MAENPDDVTEKRYNLWPVIKVTLPSGEKIDADVKTLATESDLLPYTADFAILKLHGHPTRKVSPLRFASEQEFPKVGDEVVFTGFPFGEHAMLTHKGMVSGVDPSGVYIPVEAPINKGNSGGALVNNQGHVVGIVCNREGGLSESLKKALATVSKPTPAQVIVNGNDVNETFKGLLLDLDKYISPGYGYARNIGLAQSYIARQRIISAGK